jgi:hypothetical protein
MKATMVLTALGSSMGTSWVVSATIIAAVDAECVANISPYDAP